MTVKEMIELRNSGMTYQKIADICGISKQAVHIKLNRGAKKRQGRKTPIENIRYKGIYDYFKQNEMESVSSLSIKVFGSYNQAGRHRINALITKKHKSTLPLKYLFKICEVIGKPFEEVFKERDIDGC